GGGAGWERGDGGKAPVASSVAPWPMVLAGVSVMPLLPAYLSVAPPGTATALPGCSLPSSSSPPGTDTAPPPGLLAAGPVSRRAGDAAGYSTGISLLTRPRSMPCRWRMRRGGAGTTNAPAGHAAPTNNDGLF